MQVRLSLKRFRAFAWYRPRGIGTATSTWRVQHVSLLHTSSQNPADDTDMLLLERIERIALGRSVKDSWQQACGRRIGSDGLFGPLEAGEEARPSRRSRTALTRRARQTIERPSAPAASGGAPRRDGRARVQGGLVWRIGTLERAPGHLVGQEANRVSLLLGDMASASRARQRSSLVMWPCQCMGAQPKPGSALRSSFVLASTASQRSVAPSNRSLLADRSPPPTVARRRAARESRLQARTHRTSRDEALFEHLVGECMQFFI